MGLLTQEAPLRTPFRVLGSNNQSTLAALAAKSPTAIEGRLSTLTTGLNRKRHSFYLHMPLISSGAMSHIRGLLILRFYVARRFLSTCLRGLEVPSSSAMYRHNITTNAWNGRNDTLRHGAQSNGSGAQRKPTSSKILVDQDASPAENSGSDRLLFLLGNCMVCNLKSSDSEAWQF